MAGKRDREKLRSRVQKALRSEGRTQKAMESSAGLPNGTMTRIFGGRRKLDEETLRAVADELGIAAEELVAGTSFTELLEAPEPEPEPDDEADAGESEATAPEEEAAEASPSEADEEPEPEAEPEPEPEPEPEAEPEVDEAPASEGGEASRPEPAPKSTYVPPPTPEPESEPRSRKRDLPKRAMKFFMSLVFGE